MLCRLKFSKSLGADKVRSLIVHPLSKQASQPAQLAADYRAVVTITYSKVLLTESAEGFYVFWFCIPASGRSPSPATDSRATLPLYFNGI